MREKFLAAWSSGKRKTSKTTELYNFTFKNQILVYFFLFWYVLSRKIWQSDSAESDLKTRGSMYALLFKTLMLEIVILGVIAFYYVNNGSEGCIFNYFFIY
jgi:hypothetical protein